MSAPRRVIAIDGRLLSRDQCHGVARVTVEMLRAMPPDADDRITLLLARGEQPRFEVDDLLERFAVRRVGASVARPYDVRELRGVLTGVGADVLFAPYHPLAPLHLPCALVTTVHDCILEADHRLLGSRLQQAAYVAKTALTMRQAEHVVVPSEATAAALVATYRSVPPLTVCRNGVAPAVPAGERLPVVGAGPYVLHVGALRRHKNQGVLVEALAHLPAHVRLVLVGHHDPRADYEIGSRIAALGLTDRVTLLDEVTDAELASLYAHAAAFAFPSTAEGFGLPLLEAMRAGAPVVASAVPAVAEVAGGAALLVSPYDVDGWAAALGRVLASPATAADLTARGHAVVAASGWAGGARRLLDVLSSRG